MFRITILIAVLAVLSCGGSSEKPVITIGERELYPGDIESAFDHIRGDTAQVDVMVSSIVNREMILMDARERPTRGRPVTSLHRLRGCHTHH